MKQKKVMINKTGKILRKGMTLSELLVVLAILGIVLIAVYAFEANIFIYTGQSQAQISNTWQAEAVLKPMTQELRTMVPSANGSYPILSAATSSVVFFTNSNHDSNIERIRYFLASSTLYRGQIVPTGIPPTYSSSDEKIKVLANGVSSSSTTPIFTYFDGNYEGTSSPLTYPMDISKIRLVCVGITIDTDPNRSPIPKYFSSCVSLRNLKSNL